MISVNTKIQIRESHKKLLKVIREKAKSIRECRFADRLFEPGLIRFGVGWVKGLYQKARKKVREQGNVTP